MSAQGPTVFNGRYELHRQVARGGMADVYLARDLLLDRPVAVKVLFDQFSRDPNFVERFRREAQAAANLNHPNVVSVFDWGEEQGTYFIVMEYVEGRSLAEILRTDGPLPADRAAEVASDIAAALAFAHRNGLVHRDVKPGNVLVTASGHVKVADFGIATAMVGARNDLTQSGSVMGTAAYFSPEQAQGRPVDPRSDLYSLGVVLYEMLLGRPPFTGDTPVAVAYRHVQDQPLGLRAAGAPVAESLEAITLKLLAKNPVNRYPTSEDLRNDLKRYRDGAHDLRAVPPPAIPSPSSPVVSAAPPPVDFGTASRHRRDDGLRRTAMFTVVLVGLLVSFGFLVLEFFDTLGMGGDEPTTPAGIYLVEVPTLIGQPLDQARATLRDARLSVQMDYEANADFSENTVFSQEPAAGTKIEPTETVRLWVSRGTGPLLLLDVSGDQAVDAERDLEAMGLRVETVGQEHPVAPAGEVVSQSPDPGTEVVEGARVILFVSTGPAVEAVPDLSNRPVLDAMNILSKLGWQASTAQERSRTVPEGQVVRTEPPAHSQLAPGSTIVIVVSSGLPLVLVPDVEGLMEDRATEALRDLDLEVNVRSEVLPAYSPNDGRVISQSPTVDTEVDLGTRVTIVIGRAEEPPDAG
ncbi:MAG: serine/threonine protein kinase [Acidimicrobiaceae bacterium]|nr:serine/threonine protein kinase [Acidimicrobiaceae bacterium]